MKDRYEEMMSKIIDSCQDFFNTIAADLRGKHWILYKFLVFAFVLHVKKMARTAWKLNKRR